MDDILIYDGAVKTKAGWLNPGYVVINGGKIRLVGAGDPGHDLKQNSLNLISAEGKAVIPGLTNGHTHFSQTFMRGLSAGRTLMRWLKELIWPLQSCMTVEDMRLAALLGLVENLKNGATSVVDHHKITTSREHTKVVIEAARQIGINCVIARLWSDQGVNSEDSGAILDEMQGWYDLIKAENDPNAGFTIQFASGPATPWRCKAETMLRAHDQALRNSSFTHMHAAENSDEIKMSVEMYGETPIRWLDSLGLVGPATQIVHAVWVDEEEIDLLAERKATVVHCPVSNAVIGSGIAPASAMAAKGVKIRLGTDGPASNDSQDPFETAKIALSLTRAHLKDGGVLEPAYLLGVLTDGNELSAGSKADVAIVNLTHERAAPVHDFDSALVLCCHGSDVDTVITGGKILMQDRRVLVIDEKALLQECNQMVKSLRKRAGLE